MRSSSLIFLYLPPLRSGLTPSRVCPAVEGRWSVNLHKASNSFVHSVLVADWGPRTDGKWKRRHSWSLCVCIFNSTRGEREESWEHLFEIPLLLTATGAVLAAFPVPAPRLAWPTCCGILYSSENCGPLESQRGCPCLMAVPSCHPLMARAPVLWNVVTVPCSHLKGHIWQIFVASLNCFLHEQLMPYQLHWQVNNWGHFTTRDLAVLTHHWKW